MVYWFLPVRMLMKDQFRSDERIGKVRVPLLVLHGAKDRVVPMSLGENLFALANEPKRMFRRYVLGNPVFLARSLASRGSDLEALRRLSKSS